LALEDMKKTALRKDYFFGFCSNGLAHFLAHDTNWSYEQKEKILSLAKRIAFETARVKVHIEDFQIALRELRKKGIKV
jgi:hypothetical protein